MSLANLIAEQIASGLKRSTITTASKWAAAYRVMGNPFPGKFGYNYHPWLLEMHDAEEDRLIGQKAAQMGYTEWAMNMAFYYMDIKGWDVLYVLPTESDASDFSAARFDPALEMSPHLRNFFGDVNNVGLKRAGTNILYVRGSHSRSKLKSIPTPVIIWDELDEMPKGSVALGEERQSGQMETKTLMLSTPSIEDVGINEQFKLSTQDEYFFRCPHCSRLVNLVFPDDLIVCGESLLDPDIKKSYIQCNNCKRELKHEEKPEFLKHQSLGGTGRFIPTFEGRDARGFAIHQFYSCAKAGNPVTLAKAKLMGDKDPTREQEWYNSKGGKTHAVKGAKVTDEDISNCRANFHQRTTHPDCIRTLGCDVGAVLHIVIKEWRRLGDWVPGLSINDQYKPRIILETTSSGKPNDFSEAYDIFHDLNCLAGVVDAEPERRAAMQFAQSLWGKILLCDYLWSQTGREARVDEEESVIKVNRTAWMDLSLGRYKRQDIELPQDLSTEFIDHIKEPTRIYKEDKWGNNYGVYENVNPDHFAHADTYAEIALPFALGLGEASDIKDMYR